MFTGIVEGTGTVMARSERPDGICLAVDAGLLVDGTRLGDSVAVNGCCLTVARMEGTKIEFDLLRETEERTNLRDMGAGARVNLERSLRADARLGGHFVTGHVDATGTLLKWEPSGKDHLLEIGIEPVLGRYVVPKGCIAVEGMSLTVAEVGLDRFTIWIIPHTLAVTAMRERKRGDRVNLEFDLLAKYAEKLLTAARD
jgi:riboflavin synthase